MYGAERRSSSTYRSGVRAGCRRRQTAIRAYKVDPDHLADVLGIIRDVWGTEDRTAVSAQIIAGLSTFVRKQERLDYDRLNDRLRDVTPQLLLNRASQIREGTGAGTGAAGSVAQAILSEYMRKKRS